MVNLSGSTIISGRARGGVGRGTGDTGTPGGGGSAILSGEYVATLNDADGNPGIQVKLSGENASDLWRFIGADRQHEIIQATATIQGATAGSSLEVTIPSSFAQGAAGNNWSFILQAGAAPQPAQAAYVDLFGSATQYLRIQLNTAGVDGNDWKVIIARTTGATSAAASIDTTNERLTITITSTATLAAVKTAIDNSVSGVTTTLVGTNPGVAVIGSRTTAQIAGSQTHNATANTIDFHDGAAATSRDGLSFNVDTTNRRATVGGVYSDTRLRGIISVQSQINRVWAGAAIVGPSDTNSVVGSTSSTTAFSGGLDIVPLSAVVDETAETVTLHYEADVDTLDDIVPILEAESNIEARLYGGVDGTSLPQTPPFSINFVPEAILSEADIRAIIADTPAVVEISQVDATTLRVSLRDGSMIDLTVGGGSSVLALPNVPATDPTVNGTLLFLTADVSTFTTGKTVRNDADDADLTSGTEGDLYEWNLAGTKWVRLFSGSAGGGLSQSEVEALIEPVQDEVNAIISLHKKYTADDTTLTGNGTVDITFDITDLLDYITFSDNTMARFVVDFQDSRNPASGRVLDASLIDSGITIGEIDTDTLASPGNSGGRFHEIVADVSNLQNNTLTLRIVIASAGPSVVHTFDNITLDAYPSYASGQSIDFVTSIPADSTGEDSDIAINTDTGEFYMKESGTWFNFADLVTQAELQNFIIVSNNFPSTDPPNGTLLFFSSAQSSFTTGKTVRNRMNNADVTSANTGDLFRYSSANTRWLRQYQSPSASPTDIVGILQVDANTLRVSQRDGSTYDLSVGSGGGGNVLALPNIPATDPTIDGTLLFLTADVTTFTSSKTVRNEADTADLTSGTEGDLYEWNLSETKWVLLFSGAVGGTSAGGQEADTEGALIATSPTLPTAAQTTAFTGAWVITSEVSGVSNNGGILQGLPRLRPSTSVFGLSVSAYEGDTKVGETFFAFGASDPDPDQNIGLSYSGKPLSFGDNDEVIMVEYYHDDTNGDSIRLVGVGKALPASATVRVRLAVSGNAASSGQSGQSGGQTGVSFITQNLIQITQWIRSASAPADPGTVSYDSSAGTFSGLNQNGWSQERPTAGTDPYWTATVSLVRGSDGVWSDGTDWVITAASSSLIQFRNYATNAWEAAPSDTMSMMRIWTDGVWREIPLSTNNLLFETDPNDNELLTLAAPVSVSDIEYLRLDVEQGQTRITVRISMDMLAGVNRDELQEHQGAMEATRSDLNRTMVFLLDRWGFGGCMVVGSQNISQRDYSQAGGAYFNFFVNSTNQITHCRIISTFGIINYLQSTLDTTLRIVAETA